MYVKSFSSRAEAREQEKYLKTSTEKRFLRGIKATDFPSVIKDAKSF